MKNETKLTKENLKNVKSFDELLDLRYSEEGSELRNNFDAKVEELKSRPQVDFEQLRATILTLTSLQNQVVQNISGGFTHSDFDNLELYLEMMSKSSSFAHKAHKELRKLNKVEDQYKYKYRNLPLSDDIGYCIYGVDNGISGIGVSSGILEWCTNEDDAIDTLERMSKYPQFSNLKMGKEDY